MLTPALVGWGGESEKKDKTHELEYEQFNGKGKKKKNEQTVTATITREPAEQGTHCNHHGPERTQSFGDGPAPSSARTSPLCN